MATIFAILAMLALLVHVKNVEGNLDASNWIAATATASKSAANPTGGACGYSILKADEKYAAALSTALFNEGQSCGQCYKIKCNDQSGSSKHCRDGSTVTVVATSFFPPEKALFRDNCDSKLDTENFHLSQSAWKEISSADEYKAVPVLYQRVSCTKEGGVKFTIKGQAYFMVVLISNVAGEGSIKSVAIRGSKSASWIPMSRNYGVNWHSNVCFEGQSISFFVTLTNGDSLEFDGVVPANWAFGQTYTSSKQFS